MSINSEMQWSRKLLDKVVLYNLSKNKGKDDLSQSHASSQFVTDCRIQSKVSLQSNHNHEMCLYISYQILEKIVQCKWSKIFTWELYRGVANQNNPNPSNSRVNFGVRLFELDCGRYKQKHTIWFLHTDKSPCLFMKQEKPRLQFPSLIFADWV